MGRVIAEGIGTVWVHPEEGGIRMVPFTEGQEVPDWAAEQMGDHCFDGIPEGESFTVPIVTGGSDPAPVTYADLKKKDLVQEVERRNEAREADDQIEVGGNGTVKDLIAALEADDQAGE